MKAARLQAGRTQQQIADAVGKTKAAVSNFENGNNKPSLETLIAFAADTGVSLDWLVLGREPDGTYDKRIRALPEALREYVVNALVLAERVQMSTPARFMRPPTSEQFLEFSQYLTRLSEEMAAK
jgi:transcriptional regulator with XRE-family HTH domain